MTDDQWLCWFAGIVDGEGSIWVSHPERKGRQQVCISVGNTDRRMIDMIYPRVGAGRVWCEHRSLNKNRINNGDIWIWRVRNMVQMEQIAGGKG